MEELKQKNRKAELEFWLSIFTAYLLEPFGSEADALEDAIDAEKREEKPDEETISRLEVIRASVLEMWDTLAQRAGRFTGEWD